MSDDKNTGERLASIEALLSSQKEGQDRIERRLEKTGDELIARNAAQDKATSEMNALLVKVDHRSRNDSTRIDALETLVHTKIDKSDAVTKSEFEPIKDMLKRIDSHMSWGVKIVIGAVIVAVLGGGALITKPWERPQHPATVVQPQTLPAPAPAPARPVEADPKTH